MNYNHTSYRKIKLTHHSLERACERLNLTTQDEVKQAAGRARFKGINVENLNINNYEKLNVPYSIMISIKRNFSLRTESTKLFYYKGYVYVFAGNKALTLKTIVPVNDEKYTDIQEPTFN